LATPNAGAERVSGELSLGTLSGRLLL
jgi:hypothetical protein